MAFRRLQDTAFALIVFVLLSVLIVVHLVTPAEADPSQARSELEGREYEALPTPTPQTIGSGDYQRSMETHLNDSVPMRDDVLLGYAKIQRELIKLSNCAFGYEAYPTYYGSKTFEVPRDGLIVPSVMKWSPKHDDAAERFVDVVNKLANEHPNTRFVVNVITTPYDSPYNPICRYSSGTFDPQWSNDHVGQRLLAKNVEFLFDPIQDEEEYKTQWITTEHHWTLERALRSYNGIASKLDLVPQSYEGAEMVAPRWYGARCRMGRDLEYASNLYDIPTDFSQITWQLFDGTDIPYGDRDAFLAGTLSYDTGRIFNVYDSYYGKLNVVGTNHGQNNGKKCLVVGVSYTRPLKGYIAANYQTTTFVDPGNYEIDKPLSAFLDEGYDDVIVQLSGYNFEGIVSKSPEFFG